MALINRSVDEQTSLLCQTIFYYKAAVVFYSYRVATSQDSQVDKHLADMQAKYLQIALATLFKTRLLVAPSLTLLQALLSGVS